jgi:hypothetical protein
VTIVARAQRTQAGIALMVAHEVAALRLLTIRYAWRRRMRQQPVHGLQKVNS